MLEIIFIDIYFPRKMEFCMYKGGILYLSSWALALGYYNVLGFKFSTIYTQ